MAVETTYTKVRADFARLWDRVIADREAVIVKRRGAADLALIAADELSSLLETAHLLRSPRNSARLLTALNRALGGAEKAQSVTALREEIGLGSKA